MVDSLDVGGAERHVIGLAVALKAKGIPVNIACSTPGGLAPIAREAGIPVTALRAECIKRRFSPAYALMLRQLIRQQAITLIHAHMYASATATAFATVATATPFVITEHSEAQWRTAAARRLSRWAYGQAAQVMAVSAPIRQRLIATDRVAPEHVTIVPNALFPLPITEAPPLPPLPAGPRIGVVARLQPEKGVQFVLEAAPGLIQRVPDAQFVLVGDGPLRPELEARAARLGIRDHTHFLGFHRDAARLIRSFDMLLVPSLSEGTPLVILEAMEAGVPVVASAVGGIPEQLRNEVEGLLVAPSDVPTLQQAILRLVRAPDYAGVLGARGRARVRTHFSPAAMLGQIASVYQAALRLPAPSNMRSKGDLVTLYGVAP
ncbi:MAG: glycosyltransferase family 4 protein [Ktedonobacterales bacterium]